MTNVEDYVRNAEMAINAGDPAINPYLTRVCPECNELPVIADHRISANGMVLVGCAGYFIINPNLLGFDMPNWDAAPLVPAYASYVTTLIITDSEGGMPSVTLHSTREKAVEWLRYDLLAIFEDEEMHDKIDNFKALQSEELINYYADLNECTVYIVTLPVDPNG